VNETLIVAADGSLHLYDTNSGLAEKVTSTPVIVRDVIGIHADKEWWR
jgi:hypothetical protein